MVSKQFVDMEADFDSDDSGDPHGDFLALVNKQLLIEREAEKILKLMNGGSDDIGTDAGKNRQHDGASDGYTDSFSHDVYTLNTVIKAEKDADEETPLGKDCPDVPISVGNSLPQAPVFFYSQSTQNTLGTAKVKTELRDLPKVPSPHSETPIAYPPKVAFSSSNSMRKGCTGAPISLRNSLPQAPVFMYSQSTQNTLKTSQIKTEERGLSKVHVPHSESLLTTSPKVALVSSTSTSVTQQAGGQNLPSTPQNLPIPVGSMTTLVNGITTVYPISDPPPTATDIPKLNPTTSQLFSVPSPNAGSGSTTQIPSVIQGQPVHTLTPGYQVLPQMTWQGLPIIGQPYAGVIKNFPVANSQPQNGQQLSNASTVLPNGSRPLLSQAVSSSSSATTGSSTQPIQATTLYRMVPTVQQPFVINLGTAPTQQTQPASTQSKNTALPSSIPNPVDLQSNGLLTQTTIPISVNAQSSGSILQTIQPNFMSLGQVLKIPVPNSYSVQPNSVLPQASGLNIARPQSNGLVYQIPQLNLATHQSNGLVFQPPKTISGSLPSNNITLQAQQANLGSLQSNSTTLQSPPQLNQASLQSNSSVLQTSQSNMASLQSNSSVLQTSQSNIASLQSNSSALQTSQSNIASLQSNSSVLQTSQSNIASLQSNSSVTPQPSESASATLPSLWQILSLLQQNLQQSPSTLNAQTQQSSAQGMPNVVNPSGGPSSNVFTNRHQILSALNNQIQQNTAQVLSNVVNPSSAGPTPNIFTNLQQTPSTLKTQTQQYTVQGLSNVVNPSSAGLTPNVVTNLQQTPSNLKTQTQQNTAQGLPKMVNLIPDGASPTVFTNRHQILSALNKQIQNTAQAVPNRASPSLGGPTGRGVPNQASPSLGYPAGQEVPNQASPSLGGPVGRGVPNEASPSLGGPVGQIPKPVCDLLLPTSQASPPPVPQLPVLTVLPGGMAQQGSVTRTQGRGRKRSAPGIYPGQYKCMKILPKPGDDANASS